MDEKTLILAANLAHNSDTTRLDCVDDKALERVEKYKQAAALLKSAACRD